MNSRFLTFFIRFSKIIHPNVMSKFGGVRKNLAKAGMKMGVQAYMGLLIFTTLITGIAAFVVSLPIFSFFRILPVLLYPLTGLTAIASSLTSFGICLLYPKYVAYSRGSNIDSNLPIIANFMSVLASAGMPPEAIVRSLARVGKEFRIDKEASAIIGDIELLGMDLDSALKKAAETAPSKQFGRMLDGIITTSHAGGDLAGFLREESEKFRREKMIAMRHFIENLGIIAETYITFMVAAPLMLIVMLSVMAFIGGGITFGNLPPDVLLSLITFVMLPAGVAIMILAVDSMSPQR